MVESARIARGAVKPLTQLNPEDADAVVFPGGFGAAKNLSDFGFKVLFKPIRKFHAIFPPQFQGADMTVTPETERIISGFHGAGKPMALCCIAPILAAKVLGDKAPSLTLGSTGSEADWPYQGSIEVIRKYCESRNN